MNSTTERNSAEEETGIFQEQSFHGSISSPSRKTNKASNNNTHKVVTTGHRKSKHTRRNCDTSKACSNHNQGMRRFQCDNGGSQSETSSHTSRAQNTTSTTLIPDCSTQDEIDTLGRLWRAVLRHLMCLSFDKVNALRYTRALQLFLPFLTGHEAFALAQVIEAMDKGDTHEVSLVLALALQNRNVSRILVQNLGPRYDFLWHSSTMVSWNRLFDAWGQIPIIGITSFPATENFPATRNHALASIFRLLLGPGNWPTRVVTRGREGLITDNPENTAQNLAAESNGFELANRNQFGTYIGRQKLNEFRFSHRLPTDESLVRTFVAQPMATMINNGVVHVLRQVSKHWHKMLNERSGNFSHQRMEQLDPFEALRFHVPVALVVISSLRGRNKWDAKVLGPMIHKLQNLKPAPTADAARKLARELELTIIPLVCAGIPSFIKPFQRWVKAIDIACDMVENEAAKVNKIVSSVEKGILLGYEIFAQVKWKVPSDTQLERLILDHIDGKDIPPRTELRIRSALQLTTPRDKRTLIDLVKNNLTETKPAKLLLGRVKTLLQRELRRELINKYIRQMSMGNCVVSDPFHGEWYWVEEGHGKNATSSELFMYDKSGSTSKARRFVQVDSRKERFVPRNTTGVNLRAYVAVGETICRAQKAFMTIELEHGKKFAYSAFMEFSFLRTMLRRLVVVSQLTSEQLDNARLNILKETQSKKSYRVMPCDLVPGSMYYTYSSETRTYDPFVYAKTPAKGLDGYDLTSKIIVRVPPQNITIIGGGPTGLITTIHCAENVLLTGGTVRLFEARDSLAKGGSSYERAQIVRLDARWIAVLRYHLGTGFEDVFIPASGETDSQLGNTLPTQGFVEITIKDLESILHLEVSRLWSKGIISVFADSKAKYDSETNLLTKFGRHLKLNDFILRHIDETGTPSQKRYRWKVVHLVYAQPLGLDRLKIENEYGVYVREHNAVLPFKLVRVCLQSRTYVFESQTEGVQDLNVNAQNLPSVYEKETDTHADVHAIIIECTKKGGDGLRLRQELLVKAVRDEKFTLDLGDCHVIEAIGKPHDSTVHFCVTTSEPYGVLCIQGLKISMGMHNFGGKRWGSGLLDDIRSQNDQNTRIVGDFTKMVRLAPILNTMYDIIKSDDNWRAHFAELLKNSPITRHLDIASIVSRIEKACKWQKENARSFRRQTLQTRFFETGDNFYLGMEFAREYEQWKAKLVDNILALATDVPEDIEVSVEHSKLKVILKHHIDRLWYEACLETIRTGDVYNPGARHRVPRLYLINSYFDTDLGSLPIGESFRISERPDERFEILCKRRFEVIVRNVQGVISRLNPSTKVRREGNLTRRPDGNQESKVAISTFPVNHYVNYRTMRMNDTHKGYVFAFIGDEQATPHFMRYSGLTGACINATLINNFIRQAMDGLPFIKRFRSYSIHTNWSNGEVVLRGTGSCFGEGGFLRPGFSYDRFIDYLYSRTIEHRESDQDLSMVLTSDWTVKVASSLIPRGMELNTDFILALRLHLRYAIFNKVFGQVNESWKVGRETLEWALSHARRNKEARETETLQWDALLDELSGSHDLKSHLSEWHIPIAQTLEMTCNHVIKYATTAYLYNERVSSELCNQPKPVDSLVDDFAVEAQGFANSFVLALALSSAVLCFRLLGSNTINTLSNIASVVNISLSFDTMTNVSRYKIRNEEARIHFFDNKFPKLKKALVGLMGKKTQQSIPESLNPFIIELDYLVRQFQEKVRYFGCNESTELKETHKHLREKIFDRKALSKLQKLLTSKLIVDTYHINSYLQEDLVAIYKFLDETISCLEHNNDKSVDKVFVEKVFERLNKFSMVLESSLQRGPIRWGFIKRRRLAHWDFIVSLRYFYNLLCQYLFVKSDRYTPIELRTRHILNQLKELSSSCGQAGVLRREVRDMEELYWATHESDVASMIFVASFLVFVSSITFTFARMFSIEQLERAAIWATIPSIFGALLAINHFTRKLRILWNLWWTLKRKATSAEKTNDRVRIRQVCSVTMTQILLTLLRLSAAMAAAVALPFSLAENGYGTRISTPMTLPFWIALAAFSLAILATVLFFVVEYVIRYKLSPYWPVSLIESFREEINGLYWEFRLPWNDIDTKQVQETATWEYVAREFLHVYRFDTVFAADRFGAILQYLQSGMDTDEDSAKKAFLFGDE